MTDDQRDGRSASETPPASPASVKQPYRAPRLIEYGTVSELTQGAAGTRSDGHPVKKFVQP